MMEHSILSKATHASRSPVKCARGRRGIVARHRRARLSADASERGRLRATEPRCECAVPRDASDRRGQRRQDGAQGVQAVSAARASRVPSTSGRVVLTALRYAKIYHPDKNRVSPTREADWLVLEHAHNECLKRRWERVVFDKRRPGSQHQQNDGPRFAFSFTANGGHVDFSTMDWNPENVAVFFADAMRVLNSGARAAKDPVWNKALRGFVARVPPVYDFYYTNVVGWSTAVIALLARALAIYNCSEEDKTPGVPNLIRKRAPPLRPGTVCCCIATFPLLKIATCLNLLYTSLRVKTALDALDLDFSDLQEFVLLVLQILGAVEAALFVLPLGVTEYLEYYALVLTWQARLGTALALLTPVPFVLLFLDAYARAAGIDPILALARPGLMLAEGHASVLAGAMGVWLMLGCLLALPYAWGAFQAWIVRHEWGLRMQEEEVRAIRREAYRKQKLREREPTARLAESSGASGETVLLSGSSDRTEDNHGGEDQDGLRRRGRGAVRTGEL
ncbi:hypothetical protein BC830DRAFT_1137890 [Chytriomyces sp. MP71]|nr:hypothetical protein BC830DRAFT_1137890 [Chytriomyces sp. MP71]